MQTNGNFSAQAAAGLALGSAGVHAALRDMDTTGLDYYLALA